jgi:hypothetical protein
MPSANTVLPKGISTLSIEKWENAHENFTHTFKKDASFKLTMPDPITSNSENYRATTKNFQWLIKYAIDNDITLRAMGNGWSFSEVAVCEAGLVDTKSLVLSFIISTSFVAKEYTDKGNLASSLFLVQCGMNILRVNEILETQLNPRQCLKASGASNGQSMAGCISTGTHGAAFGVGAVHDAVVGLHIVTGADKHIWLQKASNPVASPAFIDWLGATPISDDDMFNAALVSMGSFGFIHGVLLETSPIFLLEKHISDKMVYNQALVHTINTLDFTTIADKLPYPSDDPDKKLYHFEIIVNPHSFDHDNTDKGIYIRTIYKIPYREDYTKISRDDKGFTYGDNALGVIQTVLDTLGSDLSAKLVPALVAKLMPLAFTTSEETTGTIGEMFNNTKYRGQVASTAIAVDCNNAGAVIDEIVAMNKINPFPGVLSMRYVKGTDALMGFTHFAKTCVMELDGIDSGLSRSFYQSIWDKLDELEIPYTLHWGKINTNLNAVNVKKMYGPDLQKWLSIRHQLLDEPVRKVFTNVFMEQCGLQV